ncbi:hypothetical protein Hanom_Chr09g00792231 [Helianthus anomalus]
MWHPRKIHSHPDLTPRHSWITYQISGQNFFQVGDDVTTRNFKVFPLRITCFTNLFSQFILSCIMCTVFE